MSEITGKIFTLTKKKLAEHGSYDREVYGQMIDEAIDFYQSRGEFDDDENWEFVKNELLERWESVEDKVAE